MWTCTKCNTNIDEDDVITCWKCGTETDIKNRGNPIIHETKQRNVKYEIIRGTLSTWDTLAEQAAAFLTLIPKEKVISVSHSEDDNDGVIIIFYDE